MSRPTSEARAGDRQSRRPRRARGSHGDRAGTAGAVRSRGAGQRDRPRRRARKARSLRAPLAEADKRVQRLETEARTISRLVNGETKNLWPPIIDGVTRRQGLREGARRRARRRSRRARRSVRADALDQRRRDLDRSGACPTGVEARSPIVEAPAELARRLAPDRRRRQGARRRAGVATEDRPAAGVAAKATSGAGTVLSRPPTRRPARRAASPNAPGWSISNTNWSRPAPTPPTQAAGAGDRGRPSQRR